MVFSDAIKHVKFGKKAKLPNWPEDRYLTLDKMLGLAVVQEGGVPIIMDANGGFLGKYVPEVEDVLQDTWLIF